jgi:glycosyltransferase involved in cell wall biosynthesis
MRKSQKLADKKTAEVIVVVPIKDERDNIPGMVNEFNSAQRSNLVLIFSEGGSHDNSFEIAQEFSKKNYNIFTIKQNGQGKMDAVISVANIHPKSIIAIWDGDHTVSFSDLCRCIDESFGGKYFVFGNRFTSTLKTTAMPRINQIANHLFARLFSRIFKVEINDALCGTKIINPQVMQKVVEIKTHLDDSFGDLSYYLAAKLTKTEFREVTVQYGTRKYGQSKMPRIKFSMELLRNCYISWNLVKLSR